jgi:aspartyl-tRNA(Asn)/glutamyl-tRNA(Gln) amidotransferase subunit B
MNSFRSVYRAIESEVARQIAIVDAGGRVEQATRGWDEQSGTTHLMRSKEKANDYRYFPDPDLVPMVFSQDDVARMRSELPVGPFERFVKYVDGYGLSVAQATQLVDNGSLATYFDTVAEASGQPQQAANFVLGDLSRLANESGIAVADSNVTTAALIELVGLVQAKTINSKVAKDLIARLWSEGGLPKAIVERDGLAQVSDPAALAGFIDTVLAGNEKSVADFRSGKENAFKFLVGQVMKASRGTANPALVEAALRSRISGE